MRKLLNYKNKYLVIVFVLIILSSGVCNSASYQLSKSIQAQVHGFASQSFIYTDENNFFGSSSDGGSFDFRELGVNSSLQVGKSFYTAIQLLSRTAGGFDSGRIKLDFAIVDYRIKQSPSYGFGIRAGRIKNPIGFYNETRDISFTRPSIILPQSIYFERTRDLSISSDGMQLYGHKEFSVGSLQLQLQAAMPRVTDENTELSIFGRDRPGDIKGKPSYMSHFEFQSHNGKIKVAISDVLLNMTYQPIPGEKGFTGDSDMNFRLSIFSLQLNHNQWTLTGEYARRNFTFNDMYEGYVPTFLMETIGESYYLQLTYQLNFQWNFLMRYDVLFQDKDDKDGSIYASEMAKLGLNKPSYSRFAKDFTVGAQWLINTSWMFQLELHSINGTGWLPVQDNPDIDNAKQKWRMAGASISYRF